MSRQRRLWLCVALAALSGFAHAETIPEAYRQVSAAFAMPAGLLYAIALTESGRRHPDGRVKPWPWTLNVGGTPHYYSTRSAACHALHILINNGRRNIDIGLTQINWRWHLAQLVKPCRALSPKQNLRIAARLLSQRYRRTGDWWIAAGRYHDPGLDRLSIEAAWTYRSRVLSYWRELRVNLPLTTAPANLIWIAGAEISPENGVPVRAE